MEAATKRCMFVTYQVNWICHGYPSSTVERTQASNSFFFHKVNEKCSTLDERNVLFIVYIVTVLVQKRNVIWYSIIVGFSSCCLHDFFALLLGLITLCKCWFSLSYANKFFHSSLIYLTKGSQVKFNKGKSTYGPRIFYNYF